MLRDIFIRFFTVMSLISVGFLSSCAAVPAADESVEEDVASDSQDTAGNEESGDSEEDTDAADTTDTTDGESDVIEDSAAADQNAEASTPADASEATTSSTSSTSATEAASTTSSSDTSTTTSSETSASSSSSSSSESSSSSSDETTSTTTTTATPDTTSTPTPTATPACSFLDTYSSSTSGTNIGGALPTAYEPSDAVWHSSLDKLFIVSDEGWITMMASDGSDITSWYIGGDLEGITIVDPDSDFIYIGVENPDAILEFNINTETVIRTFTLTPWMTGADNQGLEALTFVPDETQTEGGQFYAGHQGEGSIYVFELPITTSTTSTSVTYVTSFTPVSGRTDIAGLSYNATDDVIYVAYDGTNKLRAIATDGTLVEEWTLPGNDQEGIAIDEDCHLTITEDDATHDVWVYP